MQLIEKERRVHTVTTYSRRGMVWLLLICMIRMKHRDVKGTERRVRREGALK